MRRREITDEEKLQREIEKAMDKYDCGTVERIELDIGSDEIDLSANADVRVFTHGATTYRLFSIVTRECMYNMISKGWEGEARDDTADLYATGGPLIIADKVDGYSIVRGVRHYLELEVSDAAPQGWLAHDNHDSSPEKRIKRAIEHLERLADGSARRERLRLRSKKRPPPDFED